MPALLGRNLHATSILPYWVVVILMCAGTSIVVFVQRCGLISREVSFLFAILIQGCMLVFSNACSNMRQKLGGRKLGVGSAICFALCCGPCLVAQESKALDDSMGKHTHCLGVTTSKAPPRAREGYEPLGGETAV